MHTAPASLLAAIGIPGARQCFAFLAPFLLVTLLYWLLRRTDRLVERLFPDTEWELRLGWLNLRAERQANFILRCVGYVCYSILAAALYGIVWGAQAVPSLDHWDDPYTLGELATRLPVLVASFSLLSVYFGVFLIPKLRADDETELLEKFKLEQKRIEEERDQQKLAARETHWSNPRFGSFGRSDRTGPKRA
jgi:hypothetical protein